MMIKPINLFFATLFLIACKSETENKAFCDINIEVDPAPSATNTYTLELFEKASGRYSMTHTVELNANPWTIKGVNEGDYIVRAKPADPNLQVTYGTSERSWKTAKIISCSGTQNFNIAVLKIVRVPSVTTGTLSGKVIEGESYKLLGPGSPVGGVPVKSANKNGDVTGSAITNKFGDYEISGLPTGTYSILVEIPGLNMMTTYERIIDAGHLLHDSLNFEAGSKFILPKGTIPAP